MFENISTARVLTSPSFRNVQAKSPTMGPSMNLSSQFGDNINASLKVEFYQNGLIDLVIWCMVYNNEIMKHGRMCTFVISLNIPRTPWVCWTMEWTTKFNFTIRTTTSLTSGLPPSPSDFPPHILNLYSSQSNGVNSHPTNIFNFPPTRSVCFIQYVTSRQLLL